MTPNQERIYDMIQGDPNESPFADLDQFAAIANELEPTKEQEHEELKQKSLEWFLARWDKFTGSRIPALMKQGRGKDEVWGETAKGIILEIAAFQSMTDEGREEYTVQKMYDDFKQTRWGNKYEPEAREAYAAATGYIVKECGFRVHPEIEYMGGSFDGEVVGYQSDGAGHLLADTMDEPENSLNVDYTMGTSGIIEIKCPFDPIKHLKNRELSLAGGITVKHEYYGQIQANIEVAGVQWCDFISYDPRCKDEYKLVIIRVPRDQIYIDAVLDRVHKAKRILDGYMSGRSMDEMCREVEL